MISMKKLDTIRAQIVALQEEREEVESAPIPRAEAEARIAAVVNAPVSGTLIGPGGPNPRADLDVAPSGLSNGSFSMDGLLEMLNRPSALRILFPERITEYLIGAYVAQIGDAPAGLPAPQRRKKLAELAAQIFTLETQEEAVIEQIEADGGDVLRRGDADPAAQLGLSPDAGKAA